jgi:CheY-like chemotaxis protein
MKLILLSSMSTPDDVRKSQEAGFDRFVSKPVRKAELRQAILGVTATRNEAANESIKLHSTILVVEDNQVNQEVISQMLIRLGCVVHVASSALDGLRALCERRFDLVLMDIQMPGMDGIEALNWFRRGSGGRFAFMTPTDTPVIAVTANALEGDEERFLSLGFDDYLSKPFRQSQLLTVLTKRLKVTNSKDNAMDSTVTLYPAKAKEATMVERAQSSPPAAAATAPAPKSALDPQALEKLRELDPTGSNQLMERVLRAFDSSVTRLIPQLTEALAAGDMTGVSHVAHTLKSSSASIGAIKLSQTCAEIEAMIRQDRVVNLDTHVLMLREEVDHVLDSLRSLLDQAP